MISRQPSDNASEIFPKIPLHDREVANALAGIAKSGYLSHQQRDVLQQALGIVSLLADAVELARDQARLQEKAADEAMEERFQQAMGLLGPSLAPDPTRLEASVIDLLALALFGGEACAPGPEILSERSIQAWDNDLRDSSSSADALLDRLFADLVAAHQHLRASISRTWSARAEPIEDLHAGFTEALPGLRQHILATSPASLELARRLLDQDRSDKVVAFAPRRSQ
ncbi:MAG: hypothetical protein VBE63_24225 [Lamprobacter sp.]|uniref:hypothetical protein n=1 Tax=Lamprobacter sp. TaxID=3100796 RepID=UPI002B25860B|nr:hypothetical protein [Lamprobacter sp.]MEA3643022.1 hypothetical protein [Lamprobacter sp.]